MRMLGLAIAVLVTLSSTAPAAARVVRMQTLVSLPDRSERSIDTALRRALDTSIRGLAAMGLSTIQVAGTRILDDAVVVSVIATDDELDDIDRSADELPTGRAGPQPPAEGATFAPGRTSWR